MRIYYFAISSTERSKPREFHCISRPIRTTMHNCRISASARTSWVTQKGEMWHEAGVYKKLLDYLDLKLEKASQDSDPLFGWSANLIVVNRRKTLVAVHVASRSLFVLHGLTAKTRLTVRELILEGIGAMLEEEMGFLGCLAAVVLELAIIACCIYVGVRSPDFGRRLVC